MVMSMTGYGRDTIHMDDVTIIIEIRSVNHRFLDVSAKLSRSFVYLEDTFKKVIQSYIHRGSVDLCIDITG